VLGGREPLQHLGEVPHHVGAFGLAVHQDVETDPLLQPDDVFDLLPDAFLVATLVEDAGAQFGPGPA
jgi:hypothetical protein